jgi:Tfp pilus assembly protein FimT
MATSTLTLAVVVAAAILAQLTLPLWGRWLADRRARQAKQQIARLVEAAADRQLVTAQQQAAKLGSHGSCDD